MNDIPRGTTTIKLINSLLTPPHLTGENDASISPLKPHVQFTCRITDSRLDDELSVAVIEFIHTPRWLRQLDLDPYGFPKKTHLGTLWRGANITEQDPHGQTEFMRAAIADNLLYAEALAELADVDVNVQDNRKRTALHWASISRLPNIVMLCLSVPDCNVGLRDEDNLTAFDLALQSNDDLIPNLFYQNILELDTTQPQASLLRVLTITSEPADDLPIFPGAAMFAPARDGNEVLVAALIERRVDLTVRNTAGDTALHVAASQAGNAAVAEMLLEAGSDIDATGSRGATALHNAAQTADPEMVEVLLRWKAEPAVPDRDGKTALDWAEENGQNDILCVLLNHIADADTTAQPTPQVSGVNQEVDEVIPLQPLSDLDDHRTEVSRSTPAPGPPRGGMDSQKLDTDVNAVDEMGLTALRQATRDRDTKRVLEHFDSRPNATRGIWFHYSAFHAAAALGETDIVTALLACGAEINEEDQDGKTPLHIATAAGHSKTVAALLANGANPEKKDRYGRTSLHVAAIYGATDCVTVLLDAGAEMTTTVEGYGMTALHLAAHGGHTATARALLVRGADINAARDDGCTALHDSADNGHTDTVTALLACGAQITAEETGMTALHLAARGGHTETVRVLLVNRADVNTARNDGCTALHLAADMGHNDTATALLASGARITTDRDGMNALHLAASGGHTEIVRALLVNGADVNTPGSDGETALHLAASNGQARVLRALLARGADVAVPDARGQTALYRAVFRNEIQIVEILIDHAAKVDAEGSMLRIALDNNRTEMYDMLSARDAETKGETIRVDHAAPTQSGGRFPPTLPR